MGVYIHWVVGVLLCLNVQVQIVHLQSCRELCTNVPLEAGKWVSRLSVTDIDSNSARLRWTPDIFSPSQYLIEYRERNTNNWMPVSQMVTSENFTLTGLRSNTYYETRVCRAMQNQSLSDNCGGNCTVCFSTEQGREPPGAPQRVVVSSGGAETLTVEWDEPEITNEGGITAYNINCTATGSSVSQSTLGTRRSRTFVNLLPNTTYSCSVAAVNAHGQGASALVVGSTLPRTTIPGALLLYDGSSIMYAHITESSLQLTTIFLQMLELNSTGIVIEGMDYDFNQSELYLVTRDSNSGVRAIKRLQMQVTYDNEDRLVLTAQGSLVTLLEFSAEVEIRHITVDWINKDIYFIEVSSGNSKIKRIILESDGSASLPYCVVEMTERIAKIEVDPIHGYFYWNILNSNLYRAILSSVQVMRMNCQENIPDTSVLISNSNVKTFTIEPGEAIYFYGSFACPSTSHALVVQSTSLDGEGTVFRHGDLNISFTQMDSFTKSTIFGDDQGIIFVPTDSTQSCPLQRPFSTVEHRDPGKVIRMYRESKQPLPVPPYPPSSVGINVTDTTASVSWKFPFTGPLYSAAAFDDWTYRINYCTQQSQSICSEESTTSLNITLLGLIPDTSYMLTIAAVGARGSKVTDQYVFTTKNTDFSEMLLLVAAESGVLRSDLNGNMAMNIGEERSRESNAVAHDSYTGDYYWVIAGGQANIFVSDSRGMESILYNVRDEPFALEFDWVSRRLFWVEDGPPGNPLKLFIGSLENADQDPRPSNNVPNVQDTTIDAFNGVFFWTNQTSIMMHTLSELDLGVCHTPPNQASSLAVDVENRHLFWLSGTETDELTISQMEYNSTYCFNESITTKDIGGISFSSSSTILAYGSNTLFLSNRGSKVIYTISSDLNSVGAGQVLAVGTVQFDQVNEMRDIVVSSNTLQSLPGNIDASLRNLNQLKPGNPSSNPFLGTNSTSNSIVIEWGRSSSPDFVPNTPIIYKVDYSLSVGSETPVNKSSLVVDSTTLTLSGQRGNTEVTATVTAFSLWTRSDDSVSGTFLSLPDRLGQVVNVRVFVYRPSTNSLNITALVTWDSLESSLNYTVTLMHNGTELTAVNLHLPTVVGTSYTILSISTGFPQQLSYPLVVGENYLVQVYGTNKAGNGDPSDIVSFTVNEPDYPQHVLSLGIDGSKFVGDGVEINQNLSISTPGPIAVDSIGRNVYWYSHSDHLIYSRSLQVGTKQPFLQVPDNKEILAMAFDWIGQVLYMLRVDSRTDRLEIFSVSIFDSSILIDVFPNLEDVIAESTVQLVMNPFTGFLYWTQTSMANGMTSLFSLNLRDVGVTSSIRLSSRQQKRRARRQSPINFPSISAALAQNPLTGELLVSSISTGDILRCMPSAPLGCNVMVNHDMLQNSSGLQNIGLPATSLALNEERLYWSNNSSGIFAVNLTAPDTLIVVSDTVTSSSITALSPGQQILPSDFDCLSPNFVDASNRPTQTTDMNITNTTVTLTWTISAVLPQKCNDVVFSIPSYIYIIDREISMNVYEELGTTRLQRFTVENLRPHCSFIFYVAAITTFTKFPFDIQISGRRIGVTTLAGVPDRLTNFNAIAIGTADVILSWDRASNMKPRDTVRGDIIEYNIIFESGLIMRTNLSRLTLNNSSFLTRGATQNIKVYIYNGVLSGPSVVQRVELWPLAPVPEVPMPMNTSLMAAVTLQNSSFDPIQQLAILACRMSVSRMFPDGSCSCPVNEIEMEAQDFMDVDRVFPSTLHFNISGLVSYTDYCVQAVGNYTTEITGGIGNITKTASGVPDAPSVMLHGSILNWTEPVYHGSRITKYRVTARQSSTNVNLDPIQIDVSFSDNMFDLENDRLDIGTMYDVVVSAFNSIGEGPTSNVTQYTRVGNSISLAVVAAAVVVGASIIAIILIIIVLVCCIQCRSPKQDLHSLSYMYGPDHELSNLRDAYRNAPGNPHYTWSREDYVCTDDDLNQLSKFPRNNLKLETFIDRGQFGEVFQGTAVDILGPSTGPTPVAVKTLRKGTTIEEQRKFLSEAALMANFNHPNIVKILGVCVDNDPVYIIMELMPGGDLLKFLRDAKMDHGPTLLTLPEQIQVSVDVAHGCHYLEQQHFIHRDIAARNCLVSSKGADRVVKIGDFGLAKDLYSSDYYQVEGQRQLPVRWMAPEALLQGKFTVESDIWSYGVLLWEIMTLGNQPYPGRINQEVLQFVTGGGRLDRPDKCPTRIYHLMQSCWKRYSSDRPHFDKILTILNNYLDRLKRPDSVYYSESDSDEEGENYTGSGKPPTRTPSIREGIINLARSGSMKLRNSFRRHNSIHKREEHTTNSQEDNGSAFRERGPF